MATLDDYMVNDFMAMFDCDDAPVQRSSSVTMRIQGMAVVTSALGNSEPGKADVRPKMRHRWVFQERSILGSHSIVVGAPTPSPSEQSRSPTFPSTQV